jgi:glycosyltransferase involved in cell wall biosynthesis
VTRQVIDAIVPARNEGSTVGAVVEACRACRYVREVIVVDDGSTDDTTDRALAAGAKVIRRDGPGSKAHAMEAGVAESDADGLLFVDADCLGLESRHLEAICAPYIERCTTMSVGWFDYGPWNPLVLRLAPTTGERVIPRWVWDAIPPGKLDGYTIELMINEVIAEGRLTTTARIMDGVTHRTKRDKLGRLAGYRETWRMFWQLVRLPLTGVLRWRIYLFYLRGLTVVS